MRFCRRQLERIAVESPENLVLLDNDSLIQLYRQEVCDEQLQGNCLAELYVRWFVGDSCKLANVEQFLGEVTPGGVPPVLLDMRTIQDCLQKDAIDEKLASPLWSCVDAADECIERIVHRRMRRLLTQVDGFIPVYDVGGAGTGLFIPFEIIARSPGVSVAAVDAADKTIGKWNRPARRILGTRWQVRVLYRQGKDMPPLSERSFLLPIQVALWKKAGMIPKFNSWQLLFTGDIDSAGRVVSVRTEEKEVGVSAVFQRGVCLVAPSDAPPGKEMRGISPIPSGLCGEELLNAVRGKVEQLKGCLFSRDYALNRLPFLEREIRHEIVGEWNRQIARVDALLKVLGRHVEPLGHLRLLMLKSAAYCHSGRTVEALKENARAMTFARDRGFAYEALRLEIEQLVEFQDSQRFDDIARLTRPLLSRINSTKLKDDDCDDLLMRYHGTLGQIQMEQALLGLGKTKPGQAKSSLEKAHACARRLKRPGDEIQDLNYLHLWFAYFNPLSEETVELQREIEGFILSLDSAAERAKNQAYLRRQAALAAFMKWRCTGVVDDEWRMLKSPPSGSERWLVTVFMRVKGALAAAAGDVKVAEECFDVGEQSLPMDGRWNCANDELSPGGVFAQIRLALLVQACCSLAGISPESSSRYRALAEDLVNACPKVRSRFRVSELIESLKRPSETDPRRLPVLYY